MQILTLYLSTAVVFLALDIVMLKRVLYPLFSSNLGDWLLEDPRMGPAAVFYLFYVGGVLFFASWLQLAVDFEPSWGLGWDQTEGYKV